MMQNKLWLRIGDQADYEEFDGIDDVITILKELEVDEDFGYEPGKLSCDGFSGWNYISIFFGDADAQPVRWLKVSEVNKIREGLKCTI